MGLFTNNKIDRLINKVSELQSELDRKQRELDEARESAKSAREEAKLIRAELISSREEMRGSLKKEQDKVRSARDSRAHQESRVSELEVSLNDAVTKLAQTKSKLDVAEDEITALQGSREQLAEREAEVAQLNVELQSAERALEREPHEMVLHNKVLDLTDMKDRLNDKVTKLKARVKTLENERHKAQRSEVKEKITLAVRIRNLEHHLEVEKRLYTIQQLELESALSRAKGAEQRFEIKTRDAIAQAKTEALPLVDAELREALKLAEAKVAELEEVIKVERRSAFFKPQVVVAEVIEDSPKPFAPSSMTEDDWSQVEEQASSEEPAAEEPAAEEPAAEEPTAEEPVAGEPVAEEPTTEENS